MQEQPRIAKIVYVNKADLEALGEEVTTLLNNKEEHWEIFGDLKTLNGNFVQAMIQVVFPEVKE